SQVNFRSSEVSGVPSDHFTPGFSFQVTVRPSGETIPFEGSGISVASSAYQFPLMSRSESPRFTSSLTCAAMPSAIMRGLSDAGCANVMYVIVPPGWGCPAAAAAWVAAGATVGCPTTAVGTGALVPPAACALVGAAAAGGAVGAAAGAVV